MFERAEGRWRLVDSSPVDDLTVCVKLPRANGTEMLPCGRSYSYYTSWREGLVIRGQDSALATFCTWDATNNPKATAPLFDVPELNVRDVNGDGRDDLVARVRERVVRLADHQLLHTVPARWHPLAFVNDGATLRPTTATTRLLRVIYAQLPPCPP